MGLIARHLRARPARQRLALGAAVVLTGTLALVLWLMAHASAGVVPTSHATLAAGPHAAPLGSAHVRTRRLAHAPTGQQPLLTAVVPVPPVRYRPIGCVRRGPAVVYTHGPHRKEVAFGFDDGPYPLTPSFVQMLRANGAVATFFQIGEQVTARYQATLHEQLRDGDALGDHTYTHPDLARSGNVRGQLSSTLRAIRDYSGYTPCVFRPPYDDYDGSVVHTAASLGLATVTWNVDPSDYTRPGVAAIRGRVLAQVRPGSIVISHDGGGPRGQTLAAYPGIIHALRTRGYRFVTIPELLGFHTVYRRCVRNCDSAAISGHPPPGSIVQSG